MVVFLGSWVSGWVCSALCSVGLSYVLSSLVYWLGLAIGGFWRLVWISVDYDFGVWVLVDCRQMCSLICAWVSG